MPDRTCSIQECEGKAIARGWCSKHYHRWRRTGDTSLPSKFRAVTGSVFKSGPYRPTFLPDHPIATSNGLVSVHRKVLYDKIGPGWHLCCWCHQPVSWEPHVPPHARLTADHLDNDKSNDHPDNLAASCMPCNRARGIRDYHARRKAS